MDNRENHHKKLDELLSDSSKTLHKMIDAAHDSMAMSEEMSADNYLLPKTVMRLWIATKPYEPPNNTDDKIKELEYRLWW